MDFAEFNHHKKEIKRYLRLAKIWKAEGFDDENDPKCKEFWRLAKLLPDIHKYVEQNVTG